jgi:hypothetical protein
MNRLSSTEAPLVWITDGAFGLRLPQRRAGRMRLPPNRNPARSCDWLAAHGDMPRPAACWTNDGFSRRPPETCQPTIGKFRPLAPRYTIVRRPRVRRVGGTKLPRHTDFGRLPEGVRPFV